MGKVKTRKAGTLTTPRSFLLYGPPKRGKTTLAASIIDVPKFKRVLLYDIDLGASAIGEDFPNLDVREFKRGDIDGFRQDWAKLVAADGEGYDAVIVDTVTFLQKWLVRSIPKGAGGAAYEKWEIVQDFTLDLMWDLHEMTPVGLATFHVEMANVMRGAEDSDAEHVKFLPSIQGKAKMSIGAIPDVVGLVDLEVGDNDELQYFCQWQPGENDIAGNRFKRLNAPISTDGGMKRVYDAIKNGI